MKKAEFFDAREKEELGGVYGRMVELMKVVVAGIMRRAKVLAQGNWQLF